MSIPMALWRRKWWPILPALLFAAFAAGFSLTLSDRYQATAQVRVDQHPLGVPSNNVSANSLSNDPTTYLERQARILTSPDMLRRVVEREGLARDPEYTGAAKVLTRLFPVTPDDRTERIAAQLKSGLRVQHDERKPVIDIVVTASEPEMAARLANALAATYLEHLASLRVGMLQHSSTAPAARLNVLQDRVRELEEKVVNLKARKNLAATGGKASSEERLDAASNQLALAKARAAEAKARFDQLDSLRGQAAERGVLPEAINAQTLGPLRQQASEAQRRFTSLSLSLGPLHPELLAAQSALRDAQRALAEEINRLRNAARSELERAAGHEKSMQAQADSMKRDIFSSRQEAVQLRALERELEVNRAVYQALLVNLRDGSEQPQAETGTARIITAAVPPPDRIGPPRRLIVAGAAMGGFTLGLLLALLAAITEAGQVRREP